MSKVLITGGAGFIGYHLAKHLAARGHAITLADNLFRGRRDTDLEALLELQKVTLIEADLTDRGAWSTLGSGYDTVYHLASINGTKLFYEMPHEVLRVGVLSTIHALEWFRSENGSADAKILYTSSNEAYGGALEAYGKLPIPTPENVPLIVADTYNPRWSYAGQKLIGELFFIHYAKAYNLRMSIVRPHNFYGPRAGYNHVIPEVIARVSAHEEPFAIFGANETRSFCYIDDAVEAIQAVMESKTTDGGTYHIGTAQETSIQDLVEDIFSIMQWHPKNIAIQASPEGSVNRRLADVSKIKRDTDWEAKTGLAEGLKRTIEWYRKNPKTEKR